MPDLGSRWALILASIFAVAVVVISFVVPGALLFTVLPPTVLFIVLYFVVRWAVAAGLRDAGRGVPFPERRGKSSTRGTRGVRSGPKTTSGCVPTSKPLSRRRV